MVILYMKSVITFFEVFNYDIIYDGILYNKKKPCKYCYKPNKT